MTTPTTRYFYDSYAVMEYLNGNKSYKRYFDDADGALTTLNLMEVYFKVLQVNGSKAAKDVLNSFSKYLVDFELSDIEGAMDLRLKLKNKGLDISYADALGYYLAQQLGIAFLTGDGAFKKLDNVEFIK